VNRKPTLDELIGAETTGAERQQLQNVHEMLLEAGPPPELSPELEQGPSLSMSMGQKKRRGGVKQRAMVLLAAAIVVVMIFIGGYLANQGGGTSSLSPVAFKQALHGTKLAPSAEGTLEVWNASGGNWPMTLTAVGLPKLPPHTYYEVYLVRHGKPWGSCGAFRVTSGNTQGAVRVTLTAPYSLKKGDSWVVTRPGHGGADPGPTVLKPAPATA
jgi:N-acetylmuramoyl-L-alanine amidase